MPEPTHGLAPAIETRLIGLLALVQFVNILDFMMVMPLGPDFAGDLGIEVSSLGMVGGSYTAAAAVSGLAGAFVLDRFDRRPALASSVLGLGLGTLLGAAAWDLPSLLVARVVAGLFGGPATSLALSIVADTIPAERRGRAMGTLMLGFSVASTLGVPIGLELARWGTWRAPFVVVGGLGLVIAAVAFLAVPPLRAHLGMPRVSLADIVSRPLCRASYAMSFLSMAGAFVLIPNIAAYVQGNLGFPRSHLGVLYLAGGFASLFTTRAIGRWVDRVGSARAGAIGVAGFCGTALFGFVDASIPTGVVPWSLDGVPVIVVAIFIAFMLANGVRNVALSTLTSKVPRGAERARFMSVQSMAQHAGAALGAITSARLLASDGETLVGMPTLVGLSVALMLGLAGMLFYVEGAVRRVVPG